MAKGKGVLDSPEFLLLILGTFGAIILVVAVRNLYARKERIIKKLKNLALSIRRYGERKKIERLLRRCPKDELLKIAFSIAVWPKVGFPDELLYIPRPPHYDPHLKNSHHDPHMEGIERTLQIAKGRSRRDLLRIIRRALRNRSLRSLSWVRQCLEERSPRNREDP
jgi:hypothetical protein